MNQFYFIFWTSCIGSSPSTPSFPPDSSLTLDSPLFEQGALEAKISGILLFQLLKGMPDGLRIICFLETQERREIQMTKILR